MSDHSDDKCYPDQPISERACTGRRVSYARTQLGESGQSATNADMRRPLRAPSPHERGPQQPHSFTSFPRPGLIPWPSLAPQAFLPMPEYSIASRSYFGALASPTESSSHATRQGLPAIRYPSSLPSISIPEVPPIRHTLHALLQRVPPRHRSGASSCSGFSDALSTSSSRDVREVDGYSADASSNEEDTADEAIVEAGPRAASREAAGHRNGDVAAEGGDEDDLVLNIEPSGSTRSDSDTPAHDSFGENVDVDELDSEEYADVRTRYHHTGIWHDGEGLYRVLRDRDGRQEVEVRPRYSLIRQTVAGGFLSTAAYPLAGEREAPSSSGDEHDRGDEGRVHHPPQVDLQLEQASWTSTSAPMSSTGTASQHEPSPAIVRPSIPNLLNVEDMEVPRPWGPSAASATASPRGANQHLDTGATSLTATDATGQDPGSRFSIRLSVHSPTPITEPAAPPEDLAGAAEYRVSDRFSHGFVPADPEEAALFLEIQAGNAWSSPGTNTGMLSPGTNQSDVLSPDATSATLTGGTINIGLPEVDPSAFTESAKAPVPVLHDSTQCGQQGQSPRPLLAHPPSPRPPSRASMPSSAPYQESPIPPLSPTSDNDGYSDIWAAKLHVVWQVVNGQPVSDEDVRSGLSSAEHAANPPSTTRTAVVPLNEGSDGKKNRKRVVKKKKTSSSEKARQAFVNAIKLGGPWLSNAVRTACRLTGELFPEEAMVSDHDRHAGLQERLVASPEIEQDGIATSRGLEGAAREQSMGNLLGAANEEQLEFELQGDIEQGDMDRCCPFILWVVHRSRDETVEQAIARGRLEIRDPVRRLFFDSWNRAIATDRNNPPAADCHSGSSASTQPARGPMDPVYPAQTRVVVFVACENAYTFTVAELGDDESPLRAPDGIEGNNEKGAKKGGKKGGKKGNKKGGQQDQDPLEMLPRRRFNSPADIPVNYGDWNVPTRSAVEARAMEAEGIPEELQAEPTNNSGTAQVDATAGGGGNVRGRQGEDLSGCGAGASRGSKPRDERQSSQEGQERDSEDEEEKKKKKNAKPPPPLRSRREILEEHQEWLPIRYDDRRLGQDLRVILAEVHLIIRLSYPPLDPVFGAHLIMGGLNSTANAAQSTDSGTEGRVTRSNCRKRQRTEDEDEGGNNAGPSQPAKKRKGKTAAATSSQQAPAASLPRPPAPRGNKRRRDEATEDAAPVPKRTRRDEEVAGDAEPRPFRTSAATGSRPPRLILPGPSVDTYGSLNEALRAAHALPVDASVSQLGASVFRQPPRHSIYHPPPEQPIAGPSRLPMAGPSRPSRKRRRGDETDDDEDDDDYVEEGGPVTWESGRRAKKPKKQ